MSESRQSGYLVIKYKSSSKRRLIYVQSKTVKSGVTATMMLLSGTAYAADGASAPAAPAASAPAESAAADTGDTIVVTGARGSRVRTIADSPVPIDVIGAEQLQQTGRTGLKDILGDLIPSLTMPALGGGGTSASVRPISIRGLSGDYLLVLVNGKRRHTTSLINNLSRVSGGSTPVDIDLIPTNAVGHIELLRDGAAAQYGSDAISGVLNIILDQSAEGGTASTTVGSTYDQGGLLVQQSLGYGAKLGSEGGFVHVAVEGKYHDRSKSSGLPIKQIYPTLDGKVGGTPDPREATADHLIAGGYGRSNRDDMINSSVNAELPVGAVTLYNFSTLSYRDIKDARGASVPTNSTNGLTANNPTGLASLPEVYPDGFQAYRRIKETDFQFAFGGRGTIASWDFDLSSSFGRDEVWLGAENTLNPSIGPTSKTNFFLGKQYQSLWVNNLDLSRQYDVGLATPLQVAVGFEHRWERFSERAGEPDSYRNGGYVIPTGTTPFELAWGGQAPSPGLVSFTGTSPADAGSLTRNNFASYVDLGTNITKAWYVGFAGRVEHYDDGSGNTVSGKFSTRYEILPGLAIRGGVNTGFRAPSLAQTGFSTTQNTITIIGQQAVQTTSKFLPVDSAAAIALGAKPLKPEKSLNFTGGVTYEPTSAIRLTLDAYQIRVNDRIVRTEFLGTSNNGGAAVKAILLSNGITGVDSAQFFINGVDTRTRGLDAVGEYTLRTDRFGTFRNTAAYSINKTKILSIASNPSQLSSLNVTLFGRQAQYDLTSSTPRDKIVLGTDWSLDRLHTNLHVTRYGHYLEAGTTAVGDRGFGAKWVTDLDVSYRITKGITLAVGANDLFNVYPQKNGIVAADGSGQYGNFAPFGLTGGFYYGRATVNF